MSPIRALKPLSLPLTPNSVRYGEQLLRDGFELPTSVL